MREPEDSQDAEPGDGPGKSHVPVLAASALGSWLCALTIVGLWAGWYGWPECKDEPLRLFSVAPAEGPETGGTVLSLSGSGFDERLAVLLDGRPIDHTRRSSTLLTITTPKHAAGPVDVSLADDGCVNPTLPAAFKFGPLRSDGGAAPATVDPATGHIAGKTRVTIRVDGPLPDVVTFGGIPATDVTLEKGTIAATTPPHAAGRVPVVLTRNKIATEAGTFTYHGDLSLLSIQPSSGSVRGCDSVLLTGTGFSSDMRVTFGGIPAAFVTATSPTSASVVAPRRASGKVDVSVALISTATLSGAYTYVCPAPQGGDLFLAVLIAGALGALVHALQSFYMYVGARKLVSSWVAMYLVLPVCGAALAAIFYFLIGGGLFTLAAVTPGIGFVGFAALIGMFSAQAVAKLKDITEGLLTKIVRGPEHITDTALTVTGVSPSRGPAGTPVKISGTGFGAGTTVDFGTVAATTVVVVSDKELQAASPAGPAAGTSVDVSVKRGAKAPAVLKGGYTY